MDNSNNDNNNIIKSPQSAQNSYPLKKHIQYKPNPKNKITTFFALGGIQEVGKNCYCFEHDNEILVIDIGIKMADKNIPGVQAIAPNFKYLNTPGKKIVVIITHGHEDHIGAINVFLKTVKNVPIIYGPKFAIELIKSKLKYDFNSFKGQFVTVQKNKVYHTKNFSFEYFSVNHSIPDAYGIIFRTVNGTIVTTGDFKFDLTPIAGFADYYNISKIGHEKVDLLIADSTNACVPGFTKSEKEVALSLEKLLKDATGRIIISTFSSNVWRFYEIIKIAQKLNKKVFIFGKNFEKMVQIANKIKYISYPPDSVLPASRLKYTPENKVIVLCTGSQGEPLAALTKIANNDHKFIKIQPNDTIIFSSNPIPGNFLSVQETIDKLSKIGANIVANGEILTEGVHLHTSGHASVEEQKLMLNLIQPHHFAPIHGEYHMLVAHKKTAIKCGVNPKNIFILNNGDCLALKNKKVYQAHTVFSGNLYLSEKSARGRIQIAQENVINDQIIMGNDGVIVISMLYDCKKNIIIQNPQIKIYGSNLNESKVIDKLKNIVKLSPQSFTDNINQMNINEYITNFKNHINGLITSYIFSIRAKKPLIIPICVTVNK
ncbi:ribonuclease J [Mycoplasma sp. SG1]|uniref:ribonuclease J n=1 Tax=Mycoplasma sp. SG1 TaxID=2810348 RepID=UPI0020259617|nr:ribonuclease J [Mycoplasma sp. SG1]URM53036.1 ribonuclease J [Mycoplasma sp. SG1]